MDRKQLIREVKEVIKKNKRDFGCGIFNTRSLVGDPVETIWKKDGVVIDVCYGYEYFEIFGLTAEEFTEVEKYYERLTR